jgi:hypothetical protein
MPRQTKLSVVPATETKQTNADKWKSFLQEAERKFGHGNFGVVYRVYCRETGISYVGQTSDFVRGEKPARILSHYNALRKGCHPHRELQECFNSGSESFADEPIETVKINPREWGKKMELSEREKYWQGVYNATKAKLKIAQVHYKLTAATLKQLKQSGAINNQALVFFILKLQNPWCDRPLTIDPLTIAIDWDIPESSVYEAILKLKKQGLLEITRSTMEIKWADSQQSPDSDNPESILNCQNGFQDGFWDSRTHSEISESILTSQNPLRDIRINSDISESQSLEPSHSKDSGIPQTIQINKTIQTLSDLEAKEEKFNQNQESPENTHQENFPFDQQKTESSVITNISSLDKIRGYSPVVEKSIREMDWELIYDGENTPWLLSPRRRGDVHFHPKFMEWHGYRFKEKFSKPDIHSAIADFRSSLINQPSRIQGRWEEYENHMAQFVENTAAIVEAGVEPSEYAKAKITAHAELIAKCEPVKAMRFSEIPTIQGIDENPVAYLPCKQEELPEGNDVPPTAAGLTESCKTALGRRFVENLIAKNPGWGYEMVDGVVVDKNLDDDDIW